MSKNKKAEMRLSGKYIWRNDKQEYAYVEFKDTFVCRGGKVVLKITADYKYAAFINGQFVGNAQFTDIPEYKTFSEYDISSFVREGENELYMQAYHASEGASVCRVMTPCVCYELLEGDTPIGCSNETTLCRQDARYSVAALISGQLGRGYNYSFVEKENAWQRSQIVHPNFTEYKKPIKNTYITPCDCAIGAVGVFQKEGGDTAGGVMEKAWLKTLPFSQVCVGGAEEKRLPLSLQAKQACDGVFVMGDLGRESAGFPYFSIDCKEATTAYLGWGEHLADLRLRTGVGGLNYAVQIKLKKGKNCFNEYLRRIGCRYMCLYIEGKEVFTLEKWGLQEELYPLKKPNKDFGDNLLNKIYETGRRTLEICMHEHYEDCPWREQALYGLDARNQMLFGYGAFGEYEFARASLDLIARCIREDGWISLVTPSQFYLTIPPFSAYWIIAVLENVERDYEQTFLKNVIPAVESIMLACMKNTQGNKIYPPTEKGCWNFHEWSTGLADDEVWERERNGSTVGNIGLADGPFTALVCRAAKAAAALESRLDNDTKAQEFAAYASKLATGLGDFYDEEKGVFASYIGKEGKYGYHEYTQALFLLTDELSQDECKRLVKALCGKGEALVPITLSGLALKYEALLRYSNMLDYVLKDIYKIFGNMLFQGATSYWETEKGENDFGGGGSLCHGWSAAACYVLDNYCKNVAEEK